MFPSTDTTCTTSRVISKGCGASKPLRMPLRWPEFGGPIDREDERRDFGRNGSFLVIRQLYQDVQGFNEFFDKQAQTAGGRTGTAGQSYGDPEWLKSKLVGRWKNGSSTALHPHRPGSMETEEERWRNNEFLFGEEDSQGRGCPLGAHIRRANPRDSLNPHDPKELPVSNRHRLLRRGRTYVEQHKGGHQETGTMFMCLNANIERQFEFIQQSWLNSETFHGLKDERDPIAASSGGSTYSNQKSFDYSIPTSSVTRQVKGLSAFVELRGGGYFFMPSKRSLEFLCFHSTD